MFPVFATMLFAQELPRLTPNQLPALEQQERSVSSTQTRRPAPNPIPPPPAPEFPGIEIVPGPGTLQSPPENDFAPRSPLETFQVQEIRPLPGQLDNVPVFNSNSPEMVRTDGILLSTFPGQGKRYPGAHLNFPLQGRFDLFAHHVTQTDTPDDVTTLYLGLLVYNPTERTVFVDILQGASFLSTPDAPFRQLPAVMDNPIGYVFSGPGSRVTNQVLRGRRQSNWPSQLLIPPREARMLASLPIPLPKLRPTLSRSPLRPPFLNALGEVPPLAAFANELPPLRNVAPSSNGRSTLMYLNSSGPVYAASMALYAQRNFDGSERPPTQEDWQNLLLTGQLVNPRDIPPSPPDRFNTNSGRIFYGRVAGISQGSRWQSKVTDKSQGTHLTIPKRGQSISYGLSTLPRGTLGTGQIQSAPMLARYPDTAYLAHGNYGVHYDLTLPLFNATNYSQTVALTIQTPIKEDTFRGRLEFLNPPAPQVFFRGTVRVTYNDELGISQNRYVHLVQRRGQMGEPLLVLNLKPGEQRQVSVDFLYPPDATPPQVLTLTTLRTPGLVTTQRPSPVPTTSSPSQTPAPPPKAPALQSRTSSLTTAPSNPQFHPR